LILRRISQLLFWSSLILISWLSVASLPELPSINLWDKAGHALAYGVLMLLGGVAYRYQKTLIEIALLIFSYGAVIELVQYMLPDRQFSFLDMLANSIGIVTMMLFVFPLERLFRIDYP
jgi:VanZ family protein